MILWLGGSENLLDFWLLRGRPVPAEHSRSLNKRKVPCMASNLQGLRENLGSERKKS